MYFFVAVSSLFCTQLISKGAANFFHHITVFSLINLTLASSLALFGSATSSSFHIVNFLKNTIPKSENIKSTYAFTLPKYQQSTLERILYRSIILSANKNLTFSLVIDISRSTVL